MPGWQGKKMIKKLIDGIKNFFAEQEKKKPICNDCSHCQNHCQNTYFMIEAKCFHPSRIEKKKNYVSGHITEQSYTCWSYNYKGQCHLFEQKTENDNGEE